ncbi:Os03g0395801, partial [Oryza sativa Japonica Group]
VGSRPAPARRHGTVVLCTSRRVHPLPKLPTARIGSGHRRGGAPRDGLFKPAGRRDVAAANRFPVHTGQRSSS